MSPKKSFGSLKKAYQLNKPKTNVPFSLHNLTTFKNTGKTPSGERQNAANDPRVIRSIQRTITPLLDRGDSFETSSHRRKATKVTSSKKPLFKFCLKQDFLEEDLPEKFLEVNDLNSFDEFGNTALFYCSKMNNEKYAHFLLRSGADPNLHCSGGNTALHLAADGGSIRLIQLLLRKGASLEIGNHDGWTPVAYMGARTVKIFKCKERIIRVPRGGYR